MSTSLDNAGLNSGNNGGRRYGLPASVQAAASLTSLACEDGHVAARATAALTPLRELVTFDCVALIAWNPLSERYETLANEGYDQSFLDDLQSKACHSEMRGFGWGRSSGAIRICDLPIEPAQTWTVREIVWPAGFREGMSMQLYSGPGAVYTGTLHVSMFKRRPASNEARATVSALCPVLGSIVDVAKDLRAFVARAAPEVSVAGLAADGSLMPLPGASLHPACTPHGALQGAVADWRSGPRPTAPFLWQWASRWLRVRIVRPPAGSGLAGLATLRDAPDLHDLSQRELEILTLMTYGAANEEMAERLFISPKTVSTHLGHIFDKLGVHNRTSAAVLAVDAGLVLASIGDPAPSLN